MIPTVRLQHALIVLFVALATALHAQVTESPQTIAPGKFLLETDGIKLTYDRAGAAGNRYTGVAVASSILSAGLTKSVDLQVGATFFLRESFEFHGAREHRAGIGDLQFRTKWTFWRDDSIGAALAVIPYVKVPVNSGGVGNDSVEGGFIVPWEMKLSESFFAGAMFQWDHVRNDDDTGYDAHWLVTGFAQRNITRAFALYAETTMAFSSAGFSDWIGSVGAGALLQITSHVQLDYEFQRGLNRNATDWTHVFRVNWEW
jgi:hypothetical protein